MKGRQSKPKPVATPTQSALTLSYRQLLSPAVVRLGAARVRDASLLFKVITIKQMIGRAAWDDTSEFQVARKALIQNFGGVEGEGGLKFLDKDGKPDKNSEAACNAEHEKLLDQTIDLNLPRLSVDDVRALIEQAQLDPPLCADDLLYGVPWLIDWNEVVGQAASD